MLLTIAAIILCAATIVALRRLIVAALGWATLALGAAFAGRVMLIVEPRLDEIDWRGFWSGASLGLVIAVVLGVFVFYAAGWRARAVATEDEEKERARQKRIRDQKLA